MNAEKGAGTIKAINMAQLSELCGRETVTVEKFERFVEEQRSETPLATGDQMAAVLTAPYRFSEGG